MKKRLCGLKIMDISQCKEIMDGTENTQIYIVSFYMREGNMQEQKRILFMENVQVLHISILSVVSNIKIL